MSNRDEIYAYLNQLFEWDVNKARTNWSLHRVLFTEAATVFFDPRVVFYADSDHSEGEDRYVAIGRSRRDKRLFVVHVYRSERIRIISARVATPQERSKYEG